MLVVDVKKKKKTFRPRDTTLPVVDKTVSEVIYGAKVVKFAVAVRCMALGATRW